MIKKSLIIYKFNEDLEHLQSTLQGIPFPSAFTYVDSYGEASNYFLTNSVPTVIFAFANALSYAEKLNLSQMVVPNIPWIYICDSQDEVMPLLSFSSNIEIVLKPIDGMLLLKKISKALKEYYSFTGVSNSDSIFLKMGRMFNRFKYDDIIYFEAYGIYSKVVTKKGKFTINDSITFLEEKLIYSNFIRVHKSYIININKIDSFGKSYFYMESGAEIPLGSTFKQRLSGFLKIFLKM